MISADPNPDSTAKLKFLMTTMPAMVGFFHGQLSAYSITRAMAGIFEL